MAMLVLLELEPRFTCTRGEHPAGLYKAIMSLWYVNAWVWLILLSPAANGSCSTGRSTAQLR